MRDTYDNLSCEEVFELNAICDQWEQEAIKAQEAEMAERKGAADDVGKEVRGEDFAQQPGGPPRLGRLGRQPADARLYG